MNPGTHILGEHAQLVVQAAKACRPETHTPEQARAVLDAVLQCIDLAGGVTAAASPRFDTSPDQPVLANRTRSNARQSSPMNPVHRHHGAGASSQPPSDRDSGYWKHEYDRVTTHFDKCEAVRRAGDHLAGLITRDPDAAVGTYTEKDLDEDIRIEGHGWPVSDVARRFRVEERRVVLVRLDHDLHPLTGKPWTPTEEKVFVAAAAREMNTAGLVSTDIAKALGCSPSAVRMWVSKQRRAA